MMALTPLTLAHDYDMIQPLAEHHAERLDVFASLDDLAAVLWDLDAPGL